MPKQAQTRRRRELTRTNFCQWCNDRFECSREDAKTCGATCRSRLAFYVNYLGWAPDDPPGHVTAMRAVKLEIAWLINNERLRREGEEARKQKHLALQNS